MATCPARRMRSMWQSDIKGLDGKRRFLIAAASSCYEYQDDFENRKEVADNVERLASGFVKLGYERALADVSRNPTADDFLRALRAWVQAADRCEDDLIVFYYCGHGEEQASQYYLATRDSRRDDLDNSALESGRLTNTLLKGLKAGQVLMILDACYAGEGAFAVCKRALYLYGALGPRETSPSVYVVATAKRKQEATPQAFALALEKVVWDPRNAKTSEFLQLDWVVAGINAVLRQDCPTQTAENLGLQSPGEWRLLPNPAFDARARDGEDLETVRRRKDFPEHWIYRARGGELASQAWYFTGREQALREIVAWLHEPDGGVCVVTGGAGTGKSAILGRLVTLADDETRKAMGDRLLADVPPDLLPSEGTIDAPILVRGKTADDVVREMGGWLGVRAATAPELIDAVARLEKPLVVVGDALDEAKAPGAIAEVLRNLAMVPHVKLLLGTRPDAPAGTTGRKVRRFGEAVRLIDLDDRDAYLGASDIATYVCRRLVAENDPGVVTPYRNKPELAAAVANAVAKKADGVFLVARIVSTSLIAAGTPIDTASDGWVDRLPGDIGTAFETDLDRFDEERYRSFTKARVKALLRPLAYGEGEGLPWDYLWAPIAGALAGGDTGFTNEDIEQLQEDAGAYIVRSSESGGSVYRLYHQALAEHLRPPEREQENQRRITETLIGLTPDQPGRRTKDWRAGHAHAYVRTHLASHAAAAGMIDVLATDPLFLACAEPIRLSRAVWQAQDEQARTWADIYQLTAHRLGPLSESERASYLQLTAHGQGWPDLAQHIEGLPLVMPWRTVCAGLSPQTPHQVVGNHNTGPGVVTSVALGRMADRDVIVSGGDFRDGTIRRWDAATGEAIGAPLKVRWLASVAFGTVAGRDVIVSGGDTVQRWDAATGEAIGAPLAGHTRWVDSVVAGRDVIVSGSVALGRVADRDVIVSGGADGTVRRWDAATGEAVGAPLAGHAGVVTSVALGRMADRDVIVSGGADRTVRRWDAATGEAIGAPLAGHTDWVTSVALGRMADRDVIVSGGVRTVRRWDAATGEAIGAPLAGDARWVTDRVTSVALGRVADRDVIVSGGDTVQRWDAATGEAIGAPLAGHTDWVTSVALGRMADRDVIVSGGADRTVRRWDAATGEAIGAPLAGHTDWVTSVALGRVADRDVIVSGGRDRTVRRWDAATGEAIGAPLAGHTDWVTSVALGRVADRDVIVSGGRDRTVRRWDAATGEAIGAPLAGHTDWVTSVALGRVSGRDVIVSGGDDRTVRRWDAATGEAIGAPLAHWYSVALGRVSGRDVIVSADVRTVRRWDAATGEAIGAPLAGHTDWVTSVALGRVADRDVIVSGGRDRTVRRWDAATGEAIGAPLAGHAGVVTSVALGRMADRDVIVSGSRDGTVRRWDAATGGPREMIDCGFRVTAVSMSGSRLAVAGVRGLLVLAFSGSRERADVARRGTPAMTTIVAIHGIGQQREGPHRLHAEWWPAMQDGVTLAGADLAAHATLKVAFYGNLFRPAGYLAVGDPPLDVSDVDSLDAQLLEAWWRQAAEVDPAVVRSDNRTMAAMRQFAQRALNALLNSSFFAGVAERALIFDLKQVKAYLHENAIKTAVLARVANQMADDVKVIVAHSLGTIVAYEALCAHPEWPVRALITLGSPLGMPTLIFDRLRPPPENGLGRWPGSIGTWVNIADRGDVVALEKDLSRQFGSRVENLMVDNGAKAHDVKPYLTAKETGGAIARALGLI